MGFLKKIVKAHKKVAKKSIGVGKKAAKKSLKVHKKVARNTIAKPIRKTTRAANAVRKRTLSPKGRAMVRKAAAGSPKLKASGSMMGAKRKAPVSRTGRTTASRTGMSATAAKPAARKAPVRKAPARAGGSMPRRPGTTRRR